MRIAVTGGTGFVGRHVLAELERRGLAATVARMPTDDGALETGAHRFVEMDVKAPPADAYHVLGAPQTLIHLAWGGLPNYRSLHHLEVELPAQYQFLRTIVASGLRNLVVTGTCFEYGMQSGPLHEGLDARPENPYGLAKHTLRLQLDYLKREHPVNLTWARLFYVFGEGQAVNSLFPQLQRAVAAGEKSFNMSGGEQLRDYLRIEDVAAVLVDLALADRDHGVVNVCSGRPTSVRMLVESWIAEHHWQIALNLGYFPYPDYEPMAFWGDRRKLDRCLGQSGERDSATSA